MDVTEIISQLRILADSSRLEYMKRYGINTDHAFGCSIYDLRRLAKEIKRDHKLALGLWKTGIHDARLLACFVDNPNELTSDQMDEWAYDFNSWDLCDQACTNLFDRNLLSWEKIPLWAENQREFVRRAGFVLIAGLSVHDKKAEDEVFIKFFPLIESYASDERNYVKKAVNWSLRSIGKRNQHLNQKAISFSIELAKSDSRSARWIARDALRELRSENIQKRLKKN